MKKKITKQQNALKLDPSPNNSCKFCRSNSSKRKNNSLFQTNYELITHTINQTMQRATFISTINQIVKRQPSKQSITYQEVQKNLVFQQYLKQYFPIHKIPNKIEQLISKHIPNVKANYMDFKIKNFLILNKYRVVQKPNLPYPLCTKFQKLTDSKLSSTKSVQNKVLQQLEKDSSKKYSMKESHFMRSSNQKNKNYNNSKKLTTQHFQIKFLAKGIEQMIQNIKDSRALQNFKKQMQKTTQFKYGLQRNTSNQVNQFNKNPQTNKDFKSPNKKIQIHNLKEKQFKRKIQNDMIKYFPDLRKKSPCLTKKTSNQIIHHLPLSKKSTKPKFLFRSTEKQQTIQGQQFQEYGLSVIKQKRKKSKSVKKKNQSRQNSIKSKQSSVHFQSSKIKRLETEYFDSSTLRLNTEYSTLSKQKSCSRIPTEYDSDLIIKKKKSKSKPKVEYVIETNFHKKQSKSSSISSQNAQFEHNFKKSKSQSKLKLLEFSSSNKALRK